MHERTAPHGNGWVHFVPFWIPESLTIERIDAYTAEHTAKSAAFAGVNEEGDRVLILGYDAGISCARPANKHMTEAWHLERLHRDLLARTNEALYLQIRPSESDPPDFIAHMPLDEKKAVGIEVTQIMDQARRTASGVFRGLQRKVEAATPTFRNVQACVVYVSYWDVSKKSLPFRVTDTANDEIVDAIGRLEVPADELALAAGADLPEKAPDIGLIRLDSGASVHAAPLMGNHVATSFMRQTGFEMVHATSTSYRVSDIAGHLEQTIQKKDQAPNHVLVITAGGPTLDGIAWPSEEIYAREGLKALGAIATNHLTRVILHFWGTGETWDLLPTPALILEGVEEKSTLRWNDRLVPEWGATGRNSPCPCGSARAFKRCHGS